MIDHDIVALMSKVRVAQNTKEAARPVKIMSLGFLSLPAETRGCSGLLGAAMATVRPSPYIKVGMYGSNAKEILLQYSPVRIIRSSHSLKREKPS